MCGQQNPKMIDVKRVVPYLFHFHSLRRCRTRHRSAWRRCLFGAVAIFCAGLWTGWTRWHRCQRSGLSPYWFPRIHKHGYPHCSEVLQQNWMWGFKPIHYRVSCNSQILPKLLLYPPRPPPLPRPPRPVPRPLPGPGLLRPSLCGRWSLSLSLGSGSHSFKWPTDLPLDKTQLTALNVRHNLCGHKPLAV